MQSNPTTSEEIPDTLAVPHFTTHGNRQPQETKIEIEMSSYESIETRLKTGEQIVNVSSEVQSANANNQPIRRITFSESFDSFHSFGRTDLSADLKTKTRITYPQVYKSIALKELSRHVNLVCTPLVKSYTDVVAKDSAFDTNCDTDKIEEPFSNFTETIDQDHITARDTVKNRDSVDNDSPFVASDSAIPNTGKVKTLINEAASRLDNPDHLEAASLIPLFLTQEK